MKKKRFTEEQIIAVLREAETVPKKDEIYRKYVISEQTYYRWKSKYQWANVSKVKSGDGQDYFGTAAPTM